MEKNGHLSKYIINSFSKIPFLVSKISSNYALLMKIQSDYILKSSLLYSFEVLDL